MNVKKFKECNVYYNDGVVDIVVKQPITNIIYNNAIYEMLDLCYDNINEINFYIEEPKELLFSYNLITKQIYNYYNITSQLVIRQIYKFIDTQGVKEWGRIYNG